MEEKLGGTALVENSSSEFLLEYYLLEDADKNYGIKIEKKEKEVCGLVLKENYISEYVIEDEDKANNILELLMKNKVTPTTADYILHDLGYF